LSLKENQLAQNQDVFGSMKDAVNCLMTMEIVLKDMMMEDAKNLIFVTLNVRLNVE